MMTIFAMVNADREGQLESKIMKAVSGALMLYPLFMRII
jgi:hypothetical protein